MLVAVTPRDYRCRFEAKFKTMRSLPSRHGIELGLFHGYRIIGLTPEILNWKKWPPEIFLKTT